MKKFYVASSFKNIDDVRYVSDYLEKHGFIHTYDWTRNERASSFEDLKQIGTLEKEAVQEADFLIVILPAGKGSHIEFGIALAEGKRIFLHSPNDEVSQFETTSTFYHLTEVIKSVGDLSDLLKLVNCYGKRDSIY
ncbi:group-specific protein [Halobacillus sp. Nhm2S1]|uniref:group-specific protein n=1 Tax=Halobacillus sp. Nhm2S1 TaxID=2866716 RepID=UPI001C7334E2|nr:group-specific protein [Halobacillus sp. Nhm2S1]MBX0359566.1 group-specific protein [Halobacillus sp. Nhm2S1]